MRLETDEERAFVAECDARDDWLTVKLTPVGQRGWPDRLTLLSTGVTVFLEFKREGELPSKLQRYRINEITRLGGHAYVVYTCREAVSLLEGIEAEG